MRASWVLSHWWRQRVRSAGSAGVATWIATSLLDVKGAGMHAHVSRPLFVERPSLCTGRLRLLEPCDLVGEQARWNLRCAAGDLRGGE